MYTNLADLEAAALTASGEDNAWPKENVQQPIRWKAWRSTADSSDQWLKWDLGNAEAVNCVAVVGHNFNSQNTIKIQGNDTDDWDTPTVDETIAYDPRIMIAFFTGGSLRWWRVLCSGQTAPGYHQIGRVFFGGYFEPGRNFDVGWTHRIVDRSRDRFTIDGQRYVDEMKRFSEFGLHFNMTRSEKYGAFDSLLRTVGVHQSFFVALDPANRPNDLSFYGRIAEIGEITDLPNGRSEGQLVLVEEP